MTKPKIDLTNPTPDELKAFIENVVDTAIADHAAGGTRGKDGDHLLWLFCSNWHPPQKRFAAAIYNGVRRMLEQAGAPARGAMH